MTFKIGDDEFEAPAGTAVRIPPEAVRSVHNDSDADVILIMASTKLGDPRDDVDMHENFWPSEDAPAE